MINEYEIRGDVTAIYLETKNHGRLETLISTNKLDKAKEFPFAWQAKWSDEINSFYCVGYVKIDKSKKKIIRLHRLITNCPEDKLGMQLSV
jgi:hypothetical protein